MSDVEFDTDQAQSQFARPQAVYAQTYQGSDSGSRTKALMAGIIILCLVVTAIIWFYSGRRGPQADGTSWQEKIDKMQQSFGASSH